MSQGVVEVSRVVALAQEQDLSCVPAPVTRGRYVKQSGKVGATRPHLREGDLKLLQVNRAFATSRGVILGGVDFQSEPALT